MNIFFLSLDPETCATLYCDQHVIKILLEIVQMLYTAHDQTYVLAHAPFNKARTRRGYKSAHKNHPMCKWVRSSQESYTLTCKIGMALALEYNARFNKIHACSIHVMWLFSHPPKTFDRVPADTAYYSIQGIPECMPDEYKDPDVVMAYKNYYTTKTFGRFSLPRVKNL
jgi:hypothetical protein